MKFFHPPHLYCVTTLPSKTNTTANVGVKYLHFSRDVMLSVGISRMGKTRVVLIDPGAKVNSSYYWNIVLEEGLLPDIVITGGHCSRMKRQRTSSGPRWTISEKRAHRIHWTSHVHGFQIALILICRLRYLGCFSATSLPPTTIEDGGITETSDSHWEAKTLTAFHW